jgi:hypothetical protein
MRFTARTGLLVLVGSGCPAYLPIDGIEITGSGSGDATSTTDDTPTGTTLADSDTTTDDATTGDATTGAAVCVPPTGAPGEPLVVLPVGGMGHQQVRAVAAGDAGESYIAGYFTDTIELQGDPIDGGPGTTSAFVARLDCTGALEWLNVGRTVDAGSRSTGLAIAVRDGLVFLGGSLTGGVAFEGGEINSMVTVGYIASFDATTGTLQSSVEFAEETETVEGLAIASDDTIYAAGGCRDLARTGLLLATWSGLAEPGSHHCAYTEVTTSETTAHSIVLLADDIPVIGGQMAGPVEGLPDPTIAANSSRGFVARAGDPFNLADPFLNGWSITFGGDVFMGNRVNSLALLGNDVVVAARGTGLTQVQGGIDTQCGSDLCEMMGLQKFNTAVALLNQDDGACDGASVLCSDSVAAEEAWGIAATADQIYVTGQFEGTLLYNDQNMVPAPQYTSVRMFVLGLEPDLNRAPAAWTLLSDAEGDTECGYIPPDNVDPNFDTRSIIRGTAIAVGPDGLLVGGSVCGPGISLGGVTFTPEAQRHDGFVTKLAR